MFKHGSVVRERRSSPIVPNGGHAALSQCRGNVDKKTWASCWTSKGKGKSDMQHRVANNFWISSHSKSNLGHMLKDLIEEAGKWDLAAKLASLW